MYIYIYVCAQMHPLIMGYTIMFLLFCSFLGWGWEQTYSSPHREDCIIKWWWTNNTLAPSQDSIRMAHPKWCHPCMDDCPTFVWLGQVELIVGEYTIWSLFHTFWESSFPPWSRKQTRAETGSFWTFVVFIVFLKKLFPHSESTC